MKVLTPCFADSRGGGFGFEGRAFEDNALGPVKGLLDRIPGVTVAAAVNDAADGDTLGVVEGGVAVVEVGDAEGSNGRFCGRAEWDCPRHRFCR